MCIRDSILAVDRVLDMIRTSVNVTGDAAIACIVAKTENQLDENIQGCLEVMYALQQELG